MLTRRATRPNVIRGRVAYFGRPAIHFDITRNMSRYHADRYSFIVIYPFTFIIACVWWSAANTPWYVDYYLIAVNVAALVAFWVDKDRAVNGEWRIPEVRLHLLTLAGGVLGTAVAMVVRRHKIRKLGFHAMYFVGIVTFCMIASALAPSKAAKAASAAPVTAVSHKSHTHQKHHGARHDAQPEEAASS